MQLELERNNHESNRSVRELDTIIVKELWLKWFDNDKVKVRQLILKLARKYNMTAKEIEEIVSKALEINKGGIKDA